MDENRPPISADCQSRRLGALLGPLGGPATAAANIVTSPACGLEGAGPGTYVSTSNAQNGAITTYTQHVGNPGENSWTNITTQNPDGSSSSRTYNSDGTSSSSYTPPIPNLGPLSYDNDTNSDPAASGGGLTGLGGVAGGDDSGGGGNYLYC